MSPPASNEHPGPRDLFEHASWLRRLACALALDESSADDLVQDALSAAISARRPIRDLRAFLAGVLRRRSSEVRRTELRRRRREQLHAGERDPVLPGADQALERLETMRILLEELQQLPAAQREALTLRFIDGLEPVDIARRAGLAPATVRAHVSRGLASLRERLDRRWGDRASWIAACAPWLAADAPHAAMPPASPTGPAPAIGVTGTKLVGAVLVPLALLGTWLGLDRASGPGRAARPAPGTAALHGNQPPAGAPQLALPDADGTLPEREAVGAAPPSDVNRTGAHPGPGAGRRVEGTVVDLLTGEPLPYIELRILPAGELPPGHPPLGPTAPRASGTVRVRTDSAGAFSSDAYLATGSVNVIADDGHGHERVHRGPQRVAFPFEAPIAIEVGPTFRFATNLPVGVDEDDLTARFGHDGPSDPRVLTSRLRHGGLPWTRFPPGVCELSGDGPWTIEVSDEAGLWWAEARVDRKRGIEPHPLELQLEPRGALAFSLRRAGGGPAPQALVDVEPLAGGAVRRIYLDRSPGEPVAHGNIGRLEPGAYRWRAGHESGEVEVRAGQVVDVPIAMTYAGATFDVDVELDTSALDDFDPTDTDFVVLDATDIKRSFPVAPERVPLAPGVPGVPGGRWRLRILDLPEGRWNLEPVAGFSPLRWTPERITLEVGLRPPVLVARRRGPDVVLRATILDATSGAPLTDAQAAWSAGGLSFAMLDSDAEGVLVSPTLAADEESHLLVRAPGHRMASLHILPDRTGEEFEVSLERGWASIVRVIQADGLGSAPGVEVLVDGVVAGRTDEKGLLRIDGPGPPQRIELGADAPPIVLSPFDPPGLFPPDPLTGWTFVVREP